MAQPHMDGVRASPVVAYAAARIEALGGLTTEGIFRVSCERSQQQRFGERLLQHAPGEAGDIASLDDCGDPHVAAAALKFWLRRQRVLDLHRRAGIPASYPTVVLLI